MLHLRYAALPFHECQRRDGDGDGGGSVRSGGQGEVVIVSNLFVNQPSIKCDGDSEAPGDQRKGKQSFGGGQWS